MTIGDHNLKHAFDDIDVWIFDLDNTLYPAECALFHQIDARMAAFIQNRLEVDHQDARKIQKDYYVRYGTTLSGLMREHNVAPGDFLGYVHDIDASVVPEDPVLRANIGALPGRKFVFTNGTVAHAENVLGEAGLTGLFEDIFDIEAASYTPKPRREAYDRFFDRAAAAPGRAAMFEDIAHNLAEPHALGVTTVLVASSAGWMADEPPEKRPAHSADTIDADHVHHVTTDLAAFLGQLTPSRPQRARP